MADSEGTPPFEPSPADVAPVSHPVVAAHAAPKKWEIMHKQQPLHPTPSMSRPLSYLFPVINDIFGHSARHIWPLGSDLLPLPQA